MVNKLFSYHSKFNYFIFKILPLPPSGIALLFLLLLLCPVRRQVSTIHSFLPCFLQIQFDITLPVTPRCFVEYLTFTYQMYNVLLISPYLLHGTLIRCSRFSHPELRSMVGGWKKGHNEKLRNVYYSPHIIGMMKTRRM